MKSVYLLKIIIVCEMRQKGVFTFYDAIRLRFADFKDKTVF